MQTSFEDITHCDIFYPKWNEFQNFSEYLEKVSKIAKSGIFKVKIKNLESIKSFINKQVVPPKCWKARKDDYKNIEFSIPQPIEQIITGKDGFYELFLLQRESRPLSKYKKSVECFDKITDNKKTVEIEKLVSNCVNYDIL